MEQEDEQVRLNRSIAHRDTLARAATHRLRLELTENDRLQTGQSKGFSPVCMWEWTLSADGLVKRFSHTLQTWMSERETSPESVFLSLVRNQSFSR